MNDKLSTAIEVLLAQLEEQLQEVAETKKTINGIRKRMGEAPMFTDVSVELVSASGTIRADQYYGKGFSTAAQEYLERKKQALSGEEILQALTQGGFDFKAVGWAEKDRLRNVAISLAKNSKAFHKLPNGTFGLMSWYPDVQKRLERDERSPGKDKGETNSDEKRVEQKAPPAVTGGAGRNNAPPEGQGV